MKVWREYLHQAALVMLAPGEALLNTHMEMYLLRKTLSRTNEFKGIARFQGSCRRFREIFSLITLNPSTQYTDPPLKQAYQRYQKAKQKLRRVDSYDLIARLARKKDLGIAPRDLVLDGFYWLHEAEWRCLANLVRTTQSKVFWVGDFFEEFMAFIDRDILPILPIRDRIEQEYRKTVEDLQKNPPSSRQLYLLPDRVEEVKAVATCLKQWMIEAHDRGASPDLKGCVVFFYNIQTYLPLVQRIFPKFGIPFHTPDPPDCASLPFWGFLKRVIELPTDKALTFQDLKGIIESGFFPTTVDTSASAVREQWHTFAQLIHQRYAIELPIDLDPANQELNFDILIRVATEVSAVTIDLDDLYGRFLDSSVRFLLHRIATADYEHHKERSQNALLAFLHHYFLLGILLVHLKPYLEATSSSQKIEALIEFLKNVVLIDPQEERSRRAREQSILTLIELAHTLAELDQHEVDASLIAETLAAALSSAREPLEPIGNKVMVTGSLAVAGLEPKRLYIGGLVEGEFPPQLVRSFRWQLVRELDPLDNIVQSRYLITRFLTQIPYVKFFCPRADHDGPLKKSPFLIDGDFIELPGGDLCRRLSHETATYLLDEETLYKEAGTALRSGGASGNPAALLELSAFKQDPARLRNIITMQACRSEYEQFSEYEGIIGPCFSTYVNHSFSVTALEDLAKCPMRFHFKEHLRLERLELPSPVLRPTRAGSLLHRILERFFKERGFEPVTQQHLDTARQLLAQIAQEEFAAFGATDPSCYQDVDRTTLVSGLNDGGEKGALYRWLELEAMHSSIFSPARSIGGVPGIEFKYPQPGEQFSIGGFRLAGRIDRIDLHCQGDYVAVFDYKRGAAPEIANMESHLNLQLPTYAYYVEQKTGKQLLLGGYISFKGTPSYSIQLVSLAEDSLEGPLLGIELGQQYGMLNKRNSPRAVPREGYHRAYKAYRELIAEKGLETLYAALRSIYEQGHFHYTIKDPELHVCTYCEYQRVCRKDLEKAKRIRSLANRQRTRTGLSELPPLPPPPDLVGSTTPLPRTITPQQEAALDLNRNIVVTAGAGSGKTEALVERALAMFESRVPIDRVLIITFTKKAAQEMRERIYSRLSREIRMRADKVAPGIRCAYEGFVDNYISTIDSFCLAVLREFADRAMVNPDLELAHDFLLRELREEVLSRYIDGLARQGDQRLGLLLRKWSHQHLKELVGTYVEEDRIVSWIDQVINTPSYLAGGEGSGHDPQTIQVMHSWYQAFARLVRECRIRYLALKDVRGLYTFTDLKRKTLSLLESSPETLKILRQRFRYIMVDEFQDTDEVQWKIVRLLGSDDTSGGELAGDKLFLVGDEKQSIFRFRGADLPVFKMSSKELVEANRKHNRRSVPFVLRQHSHYVPSELEMDGDIRFRENFRSDGNLITFFNEFFDWLFTEPIPQPFHAAPEHMICPPEKANRGAVHVHIVLQDKGDSTEFDVVACLARELARTWKDHTTAILIRSRTSLEQLEHSLRAANVPYRVYGGIGYYQTTEVKDIWLALSCINDPHDDMCMVGLLRSPLIGLSDRDIWEIASSRTDPAASLFSTMKGMPSLRTTYEMLSRWVALKKETPLEQLLQVVIEDAGYMLPCASMYDWEQRLANIEKLFRIAADVSRIQPSLGSFVSYLDRLIKEEDLEQDNPVYTEDPTPVQVMTIHAAKGLQFSHVILADAFRPTRSEQEPLLVRMDDGQLRLVFNIPEDILTRKKRDIPYVAEARAWNRLHVEAETKRLLYVALTRAIHNVIIVGSDAPLRSSSSKRSSLFKKWLYQFLDLPETLDETMVGTRTVKGVQVSIHGPGSRFLDEDVCRIGLPSWEKLKRLIPTAPSITVRQVEVSQPILCTPSHKAHAAAIGRRVKLKQRFIPFERTLGSNEPWIDADLREALSPKIGEVVHRALAAMKWEEQAIRASISSMVGGLLSSERLETVTAGVMAHLENVRRSSLWPMLEQAHERYPELDFSVRIDAYLVQGTIDLLCRFCDGWRIYEWKTVTVDSQEHAERLIQERGYDNQIATYFLAVQELTGEAPLSASVVLTGWGICEMTR